MSARYNPPTRLTTFYVLLFRRFTHDHLPSPYTTLAPHAHVPNPSFFFLESTFPPYSMQYAPCHHHPTASYIYLYCEEVATPVISCNVQTLHAYRLPYGRVPRSFNLSGAGLRTPEPCIYAFKTKRRYAPSIQSRSASSGRGIVTERAHLPKRQQFRNPCDPDFFCLSLAIELRCYYSFGSREPMWSRCLCSRLAIRHRCYSSVRLQGTSVTHNFCSRWRASINPFACRGPSLLIFFSDRGIYDASIILGRIPGGTEPM